MKQILNIIFVRESQWLRPFSAVGQRMHGASQTAQEHHKKVFDLTWLDRTCEVALYVLQFKSLWRMALWKDTPETKVTETVFFECCMHLGTHSRSALSGVWVIRKGQVHELLQNVAQDGKTVNVRILSCSKKPLFPLRSVREAGRLTRRPRRLEEHIQDGVRAHCTNGIADNRT